MCPGDYDDDYYLPNIRLILLIIYGMLDIMVSTYASNSSGIAQFFKEISCCAASISFATITSFPMSPLGRIVVDVDVEYIIVHT